MQQLTATAVLLLGLVALCGAPRSTALEHMFPDTDDGSAHTAGPGWNGNIEAVSWHPRAFRLKGFLSPSECDFLMDRARDHLQNSTVLDNKTNRPTPSKVRTSSGMFFSKGANVVLRNIEERIAKLTHLPVDHGEGMQVLKYINGQEYQPHHDWFHKGFPDRGSGQRIATVLMYLTTPEEGGETVFPIGRPKVKGPGWSKCAQQGYAMKAIRGDAVLFWALKPDGTEDHASLHGSCPTTKGEKWSATKWLHVKGYGA